MTATVKPLRGRVVIRPDSPTHFGHIVLPDMHRDWKREADRSLGRRAQSSHRGRVLAMGEPARNPAGHEVPHGFKVGDAVVYVWTHNEKEFTKPWTDGQECCWVSQEEVISVIDE